MFLSGTFPCISIPTKCDRHGNREKVRGEYKGIVVLLTTGGSS